jgi:hypothetical protein
MSAWKKFDEARNFKIKEGVLVIKPNDKEKIVPIFCEVCDFPMKSVDDFLSFKEYECCDKCKIYIVAKHVEQWKTGWRPRKDSEEMKHYVEFRTESFKPTIRFK